MLLDTVGQEMREGQNQRDDLRYSCVKDVTPRHCFTEHGHATSAIHIDNKRMRRHRGSDGGVDSVVFPVQHLVFRALGDSFENDRRIPVNQKYASKCSAPVGENE